MSAIISLTAITFAGNVIPAAPITDVVIKYRLTSDPDVSGSYTTFTTTAVINTDGTLQGAPVIISGLLFNTSYTVWIKPPCGNGFKKAFVTAAPGCVDVTEITGTVSES